jgi:PKD repeat protein
MAIPQGSFYPRNFDSEVNLYTVQDSLQVSLAQDYRPGDTVVWVDGDISGFPPSGIITLIDQCSDPKERSVALYYGGKSKDSFLGVEPTPDTIMSFKPRKLTKVTMQLRAEHHNSLVDSIMAIQKYLGTLKTEDKEPNGSTIIGRINFLQSLIFMPKAWFEADRTIGLVPFTVTFTSGSGGTSGPVGDISYIWTFGDDTDMSWPESSIQHTYNKPGVYDVTLTVRNSFGEDTITLHRLIHARMEAPEEAVVSFIPQPGQIIVPGTPAVLRTPVNQLVTVEVAEGESRPGVSNAGEHLDRFNNKPLDPITSYTWDMGDELPHGNSPSTRAAYAIGGLHDMTLRTDTECGAYRITTYENCIDAVETRNLWLWTMESKREARVHEFGLNCETFKVRPTGLVMVGRNETFLNDVPNSEQQKREFKRNCGFAPRNEPSGLHGTCLLFWASGRGSGMPLSAERVIFTEYDAFSDVYMSMSEGVTRPWNWAAMVSPNNIYFILGLPYRSPPGISPTNQTKSTFNLTTLVNTEEKMSGYTYINGAQEVGQNPANFGPDGQPEHGHFSVYRTAWRGDVGYLLRNEDVDEHFSLKNFYKTDGTIGTPFMSLIKLVDVPGGGRKEGQLVALNSGVFLFSNSGIALAYNDSTGTWETTGGGNPGLFKTLQDSKVVGYENEANTLLVASDGDRKAFLSFDYSHNAFIKFSDTELTFSALGSRPKGEQWQMGVY